MHDVAPFFPVIFGLVILVVVLPLISRIGGWASLAERYRCEQDFSGQRWNFQSGQFRWFTGYNNCLTVGADQRGLFLGVFWILRVGHPPLFIPWTDISVSRKKGLWMNFVRFSLGRELGISLSISERLAEKLQSVAGKSWPVELVSSR